MDNDSIGIISYTTLKIARRSLKRELRVLSGFERGVKRSYEFRLALEDYTEALQEIEQEIGAYERLL